MQSHTASSDGQQTLTTYDGPGPDLSILNALFFFFLDNGEASLPMHQTQVSNVLTFPPDPKSNFSMDPKPELEVSHPRTPSQTLA